MKRLAFTMIELIFVIVILGILAAVAIPKLTATRDDAKISKGAKEIGTFISDIASYRTAIGQYDKPSDMSNVTVLPDTTAHETALVTHYLANGANCVTFTFLDNDTNVTVSQAAAGQGEIICDGIYTVASRITGGLGSTKSHRFGGSSVKF